MKFNWLTRGFLMEETAPEGGEKGGGGAPKDTITINGKEVKISDAASAMSLYQALADPDTGKEIIKQLALRNGILTEDDKKVTPNEEKKIEAKFTKLMKTKLGKEYDKFSDMLGPVFDEAIEGLRAELKDELTISSDSGTWGQVVEQFMDNHKFTPEIETEMQRLITRNGGRPQGIKGKAANEYLKDMYDLACHKLKVDLTKVEDTDDDEETDNNSRQRRGRRSRRDEVPEFREIERPKKTLTIDEIVEYASKGIRLRG